MVPMCPCASLSVYVCLWLSLVVSVCRRLSLFGVSVSPVSSVWTVCGHPLPHASSTATRGRECAGGSRPSALQALLGTNKAPL